MCHYAGVLYVGETKKGKLDICTIKIHLSDPKINIDPHRSFAVH